MVTQDAIQIVEHYWQLQITAGRLWVKVRPSLCASAHFDNCVWLDPVCSRLLGHENCRILATQSSLHPFLFVRFSGAQEVTASGSHQIFTEVSYSTTGLPKCFSRVSSISIFPWNTSRFQHFNAQTDESHCLTHFSDSHLILYNTRCISRGNVSDVSS